jgi:hypothetical protein
VLSLDAVRNGLDIKPSPTLFIVTLGIILEDAIFFCIHVGWYDQELSCPDNLRPKFRQTRASVALGCQIPKRLSFRV